MNSIKELFNIFIACYLGIFTYIGYEIIFPYQKRFIILKLVLYFLFIAFIWIKIINKYELKLNIFYILVYILGIIISIKLFKDDIDSKRTKNESSLNILYWLGNILLISPVFKKIKCKFNTKKIIKKYPFLKPKNDNELF